MMGCNTQDGLSPEASPTSLLSLLQWERATSLWRCTLHRVPPPVSDRRYIKAWLVPVPLDGPFQLQSILGDQPYSSFVIHLFLLSNPISLASPQMLSPQTLPVSASIGLCPQGQEQRHRVAFLSYKSHHTAPLPASLRWLHPAYTEGP